MKKLMIAALAALSLGMGVASAQTLTGYGTNHLPSPANTYFPANG